MRKFKKILVFIISLFIGNIVVYANSINSIDMTINIDKYGNAKVEEIWNTYLNSGTEGYKVFSDLNNSSISNFIVKDDKNNEYAYVGHWNVNNSFEQKSYKNGFNYNQGNTELCWGISEYGNRIYTLKYTINNFIEQYNDYQGIYFKLLNLDQSVGKVNIKINSYEALNSINSKIWGFGYKGRVLFENNGVTITSDYLDSQDYITLLMKFENSPYITNNTINKTFNDVYEEAMKDTKDNINLFDYIFGNTFLFIVFCIVLGLSVRYLSALLFTLIGNFFEMIFPNNNYEYERSVKKIKNNKNINYYRDIPCNKDIELAYFILNKLNIIKTKELKKGIIGAYILKWLKIGYIKVDKDKKSLVINKDIYSSLWKKELTLDSNYENKLYMILYQASVDSILNPKEFKVWSRRCYKILNTWFNDILIAKKSEVEEKHLINHYTEKSLFGYSSYHKEFGDELMNEAYNLIGLEKFLLDFSNIDDRSTIEVELWEYYLIFATLFGITDKIDDELKELYPDLNIDNYIKFTEILKMIDDFSESSYRGMKTSINADNFRSDYEKTLKSMNESSGSSSGNGGSSFSSGGSSSRGSSGGGFR